MKTLNEAKLGEVVFFKHPEYRVRRISNPLYGSGKVLGHNKKKGYYLIGYMRTNHYPAGAWKSSDGRMIQNRQKDYVYHSASIMRGEDGSDETTLHHDCDLLYWLKSETEIE